MTVAHVLTMTLTFIFPQYSVYCLVKEERVKMYKWSSFRGREHFAVGESDIWATCDSSHIKFPRGELEISMWQILSFKSEI